MGKIFIAILRLKNLFTGPMYKAVVLLLLIHSLLLLPLFVTVLCLSLLYNAVHCVILVLRSSHKELDALLKTVFL